MLTCKSYQGGGTYTMESLNSYYALGVNDYLYAKAGLVICKELGNYNNVAAGVLRQLRKC